jgi:lysophospholipid acyltransferase (LPLAT)-like uncharacterized protein
LLTPGQRLQTRLIAGTAYPLITLLCRTARWSIEGEEHYRAVLAAGRQPIIAFWHGRILAAAWHFRRRGIVAMTSANFDGQWTARLLEHFGNRTVAGSSSRRGLRALLELKREMARGCPAAFALDGPRGPARVAQPGAAWLAGATGHPLLPVHSEAARHWTLRSWDRTQIPRPFTGAAVVIGAPIAVPDTEAASVEAARHTLEQSLAGLEVRARELAAP